MSGLSHLCAFPCLLELWKTELECTDEVQEGADFQMQANGCAPLEKTKIVGFGLEDLKKFGMRENKEGELTLTEQEFAITKWASTALLQCLGSSKHHFKSQVVKKGRAVKFCDLVTISDLAFLVLVLENHWEYWKAVAVKEHVKGEELDQKERKDIFEKQKRNKIQPYMDGNRLSGNAGTDRYMHLAPFIEKALFRDPVVMARLQEEFSIYFEDLKELEALEGYGSVGEKDPSEMAKLVLPAPTDYKEMLGRQFPLLTARI